MRNPITVWNQTSWDPFRLATGFDRIWNELAEEGETHVRAFTPACDVQETESHYLVSLDVPGVAKENIKIELKDRNLYVSGERKQERAEKSEGRYFSERTYGTFTRTFELGDHVDRNKIEAAYQDGVLKIIVPKGEALKPRTIAINDGEKTGFFAKVLGHKNDSDRTEKSVH